MKDPPAAGRAAGRAVGLFGLLYMRSASGTGAEIIGSDGEEHTYHGLRHRPAHRHHNHHRHRSASAKKHSGVRMLNHRRHRRQRVNVTLEDTPTDIPKSHLAIAGDGVARPRASHRIGNSRVTAMHAKWCAGLAPGAPQFERCAGFMDEMCRGSSSEEDLTDTVRSLCANYFWASGQAVQFNGGTSAGLSAGGLSVYAPAPAPAMVVGLAPAPMGEGFQAMAPASFAAPAPSSMEMREYRPMAKFGRVNTMDERVLMPEQGFSGKLVAHDDSHTHLADWQLEYGPKADMASYEEICARYPSNEWCRMNHHLRTHRGHHHGHRSVVERVEKASDSVSDTVETSAKSWHERLRDAFEAPEKKRGGGSEEGRAAGSARGDYAEESEGSSSAEGGGSSSQEQGSDAAGAAGERASASDGGDRSAEGSGSEGGASSEDGEGASAARGASEDGGRDSDAAREAGGGSSQQAGGSDAEESGSSRAAAGTGKDTAKEVPLYGAPGDGGGDYWWFWPWSSLLKPVVHAMGSALDW